jgi:hypothetical protein
MQILITAQPAGDAPFPWVSLCVLTLIPLPVKDVESPNPVRRKKFIFSIAPSIVSMAVEGTPNA